MENNNQQPPQENPNNQFSNNEPMTFAQKVEYVKSTEMTNNKQQTTLQTLIDGLISRKENIIKNADSMPNDMLEGGVMAFEGAIDLAQSLLKKEQEQIEKSFRIGATHELVFGGNLAEKYYNKTYGNDKQ